jgi:hypothetical protein
VNSFYTLWYGYAWPSLKGNGPEALIQTIVYGLIALVFVPPIRKWFKREYDKVHVKVDHAIRQNAHIIAHTKGVPNVSHDGTDLTADHNGVPLVAPPKEK